MNLSSKILIFILTIGLLVAGSTLLFTVLVHVSENPRILFDDPVLRLIPAADVSIVLVPLTYLPILFFLFSNPFDRVMKFGQAYALILMLRAFTIWIFPFDSPVQTVKLEDFVLNTVFYPNGYCDLDLFFSGHVAAMFLLFLFEKRKIRYFFLVNTFVLGILVMIQHVHYSIDVVAAPVFSWIVYKAVSAFNLMKKTA